ncbi:MAG: hypothetical protein WC654_05540 [Patescibacteria group bacterium]
MIWKSKTFHPLEAVSRIGFLVSLISYLAFWVTDLLIPGFVSRYFSVHLFLLTAITFGVLWSCVLKEYEERAWIHHTVALFFGILASVLVWNVGESLGGYRPLVSAITLATPSMILQLIKD